MMEDLSTKLVGHICRRQRRDRSYDSLKLIDRLLSADLTEVDRIALLVLKIGEASLQKSNNAVVHAIKQYMVIAPLHPEPWMALGRYYREQTCELQKAVIASDAALAVARLDNNFVRQALGEKMRSLLAAGDIGHANACLNELIQFNPEKNTIDIGYEEDFLFLPPAQMLDRQLISRYRSVLAAASRAAGNG